MTEQGRAARYSDLFGAEREHAPDCAYCPICATISVVRNSNPEVLDHLASAAREIVVAARLLLDEAEEMVSRAGRAGSAHQPGQNEGPTSNVRRIDVG